VATTGPHHGLHTCESCGIPDDRLEPVRRVYLDVDDLGRVFEVSTVAEIERWCPACRATYPHKPATGAAPGTPPGTRPGTDTTDTAAGP
jgi:hypothetical protein